MQSADVVQFCERILRMSKVYLKAGNESRIVREVKGIRITQKLLLQ